MGLILTLDVVTEDLAIVQAVHAGFSFANIAGIEAILRFIDIL